MPIKTRSGVTPWIPITLVAAGLLVAIWAQQSRLARMANLAVADHFPEVHLTFKIGDRERCLVTDRAGATTRRSEPELQNARWRCEFYGEENSATPSAVAALDGKRASFLFVPYHAVVDPAYPALYESWRKLAGQEPLPRLRWVQLYLDRVYRGLYLQTSLPANDFSEENRLPRFETLVVSESPGSQPPTSQLHCFDRKLRGVCPIYGHLVAESIFPSPLYSDATRQLESLLPPHTPRTFLLADQPERPLRAWPLPFAWAKVLGAERFPLPALRDQRLATWRAESPGTPPGSRPLAEEVYAELAAALPGHCAVATCDGRELQRLDESPTLRFLRLTPGGLAPAGQPPAQTAPPTGQREAQP